MNECSMHNKSNAKKRSKSWLDECFYDGKYFTKGLTTQRVKKSKQRTLPLQPRTVTLTRKKNNLHNIKLLFVKSNT